MVVAPHAEPILVGVVLVTGEQRLRLHVGDVEPDAADRQIVLAGPGPAGPGLAPPVAEVAARCGFTSATYFSHAFRERFGLRAGEVRRAGDVRHSAAR